MTPRMEGITVKVLKQELKDFKEEIFSRLGRMEQQLTNILNDVTQFNTDLQLCKKDILVMREMYENCASRKFFEEGTTKRDWVIAIISIASSIGAVVLLKVLRLG